MESISLIGMLGFLSIEDIRTHKIRDIVVMIFAIIGIFMHVIFQRIGTLDVMGGLATGVVIYFISKKTGEKIGVGDALVLMLTGIFIGFWKNILLIWISTTFLTIYGLIMILIKKKTRNDRIPYIPFLLISCLLLIVLGKGQLL
jgi:leader peptidase (prepilin peptidase)/N-methyltransferase